MEYQIETIRGMLPVAVSPKPIKSVRLKVFPSGEIRLSVPESTPYDFICQLLAEKRPWINRQLEQFKLTEAVEKEDTIRTGTSTRILGRQLSVKIVSSNRKRIVHEDRFLSIYTPFPDDQADIDRQFNNWWQKNAQMYFQTVLDRMFKIVGKHGVPRPALTVKKMQTLWGSCSRRNGTINLNYYLFKAPVACIEYVILHELIHFLYPRHDRNFHEMLTIHMPDWQERKQILDFEIVLGI